MTSIFTILILVLLFTVAKEEREENKKKPYEEFVDLPPLDSDCC